MKTSVKKSLKVLTTSAALALSVILGSNNAYASTFQSKSGTNNNPAPWSSPDTWLVTSRTPGTVNLVPGQDDDVIITDDFDVIADRDIMVNSFTLQAANAGNKITTFNLASYTLLVDYLTLAGGTNSGGAANKRIVFNLGTGMVEISGTTANLVITDQANVNIIGNTSTQIVYLGLAPLPVELISFTAAKKTGEVALTWETASEKNNSGFEVQVSTDGKHYEALAFVASRNGNASNSQRYAYNHKTANKEGLVYYRLKQVDLNGESEYYTAKVVDLGRIASSVNTFPNPFQNSFELNLSAPATATADILVVDMTGKTVYTAKQELTKGANTIKVELSNQPAGIYLLKAAASNQTYTNRLVKQ